MRGVDPWISHLRWRWIPSKLLVLAYLCLVMYFPLRILEETSNTEQRARDELFTPPLATFRSQQRQQLEKEKEETKEEDGMNAHKIKNPLHYVWPATQCNPHI